jgi:hypothetical protein
MKRMISYEGLEKLLKKKGIGKGGIEKGNVQETPSLTFTARLAVTWKTSSP